MSAGEIPSGARILVVGDAVAPTGFARVLHSILDRLCHRHDVHHLGVNYLGDPHGSAWKIYPAGLLGDRFGFNRLAALVKELRPDLVFMVGDPWVLMQYAGILARLPAKTPCVAYFPVESDPVEPAVMTHLLAAANVLVTYTRFGAGEVALAVERARAAQPGLPSRELLVVPHGVDRSVFHPLLGGAAGERARSRIAAREQLFPGRADLRDAFIVLNANRNQPRKRIDVTIEAFAQFASGKPAGVKLYLHMARQDSGWDIQRLAARLGITDRLLVTSDDNQCRSEGLAQLNLIYNACDVGVNTSCAEGWGLVAFEHAATGAAQIVPRHTSQIELWEGAAELVEPRFALTMENVLTRAYYLSPPDVAAAMQRLYADPGLLRRQSEAALERVSHARFDWDLIATRWEEIFSGALNDERQGES
jgi:glycosyltransferase involved in cell wall biosynthesis